MIDLDDLDKIRGGLPWETLRTTSYGELVSAPSNLYGAFIGDCSSALSVYLVHLYNSSPALFAELRVSRAELERLRRVEEAAKALAEWEGDYDEEGNLMETAEGWNEGIDRLLAFFPLDSALAARDGGEGEK